ncbi:hypothetical protein LNP74_05925 [Klebsiella pneumoniae subsp. pneumoniae]|nr:hypothetical protein [Klebsiella pneumoniae subsp. pneumoniae]
MKSALRRAGLGGTMRLGAQQCQLSDELLWYASFTASRPSPSVIVTATKSTTYCCWKPIEAAGLRVAGPFRDDQLVEIIEVPNHPWFVACQFHPEFTSTPRDGHPLFCRLCESRLERVPGNARRSKRV